MLSFYYTRQCIEFMNYRKDIRMKRKCLKGMIVALLMLTLVGCTSIGSGENVISGTEKASKKTSARPLTVGELADYFIEAADDYNPNVSRAVVLKGLKESKQATRLQMFVLAERAFGKLNAPASNGKNTAPPSVDLTKTPKWSRSALRNLSNGGILAASDLGLQELKLTPASNSGDISAAEDRMAVSEKSVDINKGNDTIKSSNTIDTSSEENSKNNSDNHKMNKKVTIKDAKIIAQRFFQKFGTNLKDDFYTAVNKEKMDQLKPNKDGSAVGGSSTVIANTNKQLHDLILEIVNSKDKYSKGSSEQKIRDFYQSVLAVKERNKEGIKPLKKYLDAVDKAKNFSELYKSIAMTVQELGNMGNGLFPMAAVTDIQDSNRKVMQLMTLAPLFSIKDYNDPKSELIATYRNDIIKQLMAVGESQDKAEYFADGILRMEKDLAKNATDSEELNNLQNQTKRYTVKDLDELMPQAKPSELLSAIGIKTTAQMQVFDDKQFAAYAVWFNEENLEFFKAMQKIALISNFSCYLSEELAKIACYGESNIEESANEAVQSFLSEELGQLYIARYFPSESKTELEKMVKMMIDAFKSRIKRLEWMEETTKKEAIKKLDTITVMIGYPDKWDFNNVEIKKISDGGSYFKNAAASEADKWKKMVRGLDEPVDSRRFPIAAFTVNAVASRNTNSLTFPAGILQAPFYDKNASFEANLGAIGSTIAHEITHMFDDDGAKYDASGTVRNWWADNDYRHFQKLCKKAELYYNGYEAAPGIPTNGKETISENISDIGGIACGLEVLSNMENPDYDAFFRSYANQWTKVASYDTLKELAETDEHAPNILRCNRVLSNFQEFFDTYEIKPSDGMYVAPKDRIKIW